MYLLIHSYNELFLRNNSSQRLLSFDYLVCYLMYLLVFGKHPSLQHEYFINLCNITNLLYSWSWYLLSTLSHKNFVLVTLFCCQGNMMRPRTWFNPDGTDGNHVGCGILDLPHTEFEEHSGHPPDCMNFWSENYTCLITFQIFCLGSVTMCVILEKSPFLIT